MKLINFLLVFVVDIDKSSLIKEVHFSVNMLIHCLLNLLVVLLNLILIVICWTWADLNVGVINKLVDSVTFLVKHIRVRPKVVLDFPLVFHFFIRYRSFSSGVVVNIDQTIRSYMTVWFKAVLYPVVDVFVSIPLELVACLDALAIKRFRVNILYRVFLIFPCILSYKVFDSWLKNLIFNFHHGVESLVVLKCLTCSIDYIVLPRSWLIICVTIHLSKTHGLRLLDSFVVSCVEEPVPFILVGVVNVCNTELFQIVKFCFLCDVIRFLDFLV